MHNSCLVSSTLDIVSKKWTLDILFELRRRNEWARFSRIKKNIGDISPKALSDRLHDLEEEGLIEHRISEDSLPVKSEYRLTESGYELTDVIMEFKKWVFKWKLGNQTDNSRDCAICRI